MARLICLIKTIAQRSFNSSFPICCCRAAISVLWGKFPFLLFTKASLASKISIHLFTYLYVYVRTFIYISLQTHIKDIAQERAIKTKVKKNRLRFSWPDCGVSCMLECKVYLANYKLRFERQEEGNRKQYGNTWYE